jgi:tRNA G18 (ribose-2'-O)-methylase SpoU
VPPVYPKGVRVVTDIDDPELQCYRDLQNAGDAVRDGRFIAEGPETIKMLLRSDHEVVSVLLKPSIYHKLKDEISKRRGKSANVLLCEKDLMSELVGYSMQRGSLACGVVPLGRDVEWLKEHILLPKRSSATRLLAVDHTGDASNLGGMVRSSSAFDVDAVLLSHDSCDPWYRRAVRTSMGHICRVPVVRCTSLAATLQELRREAGVVSFAAVLDHDAPSLHQLGSVPKAWCVVMGNENSGISEEVRAACDNRILIHMSREVDSLNIGVAAGILLSGFRERELVAEQQAQLQAACAPRACWPTWFG